MKKKLVKIIVIILGLILLANVVFFSMLFFYEPKTDLKDTNTDPAIYRDGKEMMTYLREDFPYWLRKGIELYGDGDISKTEAEECMIVIPGMKATKTLNRKATKKVMCTSMVPQGLAVTDQYLFISAYCYTHRHNSVIYMLDLRTKKLLKTIALPNTSHVGGLAYDDKNDLLWVSDTKSKGAKICAMTLADLEAYDDRENAPISYVKECKLHGLKVASFLCYYDEMIYAGTFAAKENSVLYGYPIDEDGTPSSDHTEGGEIDDRIQGFAIADGMAVMSQSLGADDSVVEVFYAEDFDFSEPYQSLTSNEASFCMKYCQKMEQITFCEIDGELCLFLLYESSALAYRYRDDNHIDRVICIPISLVEELIKEAEAGNVDLSDIRLAE